VSGDPWFFENSLECPVPLPFAWQFWTTVDNWRLDADVDSVELEGPFVAGAPGATVSKTSGRIEWRIISVEPGSGAVMEIRFGNAVLRFQWSFEGRDGKTRITQRISTAGEGAASMASQIGPIMEASVPAGMRKLCDVMTKTFANRVNSQASAEKAR